MSVGLKSGDLDGDPEIPLFSHLYEVEVHVGLNISDGIVIEWNLKIENTITTLTIEYETTIETYRIEINHRIEVKVTELDLYFTTTIEQYQITITHNIDVRIIELDLEFTTYIDVYRVSL